MLWAATGQYDAQGQAMVSSSPIQIKVRWNANQTEMEDPKRNTIKVDATVVVNQDIPVDSIMWQGRLVDFAGTSGPLDAGPDGLMQVKAFGNVNDLKSRIGQDGQPIATRTIGLVRFKTSLPN